MQNNRILFQHVSLLAEAYLTSLEVSPDFTSHNCSERPKKHGRGCLDGKASNSKVPRENYMILP